MIYVELFLSFLKVGLFSVGGGYAAIPLIQSQIVEGKNWITMSEFTNLVTIAEMTPGPISVNSATFVGIRIAGIPGAFAATAGCIAPALFIVTFLAFLYYRYKGASAVGAVLSSLRPAVVALIAAAGLSMLKTALFGEGAVSAEALHLAGGVIFLAAFLFLRRLKWNPILVMCLCGGANLLWGILSGGQG